MSRIQVIPYDPEWPRSFARIRDQVWPAVREIALGGATSEARESIDS
ncbi:MAG: hypothetical protein U0527_01400 [Candidatus Eisenbacteria bacterium]